MQTAMSRLPAREKEKEPVGFLNINKPAGMTSHGVVDALRKLYGVRRIGHAGTLDPCASGVLLLGIGKATKQLSRIESLVKHYEAEVTFGFATDTLDFTGKKTEEKIPVSLEQKELENALEKFNGEILQVVPAFSALRVNGKHFYELARKGIAVPRRERKITIYELRLMDFIPGSPAPRARIFVKCSKGTYIRALCADIGKETGYPAHMSALTRTAIGTFRLSDALDLEYLTQLSYDDRCRRLLSQENLPS